MKSSKKSTSKTVARKSTTTKNVKRAVAKLTAATRIMFKSPRPKGAGNEKKTKLLNLVPKKGTITFKQLLAKATSALEVPEAKVGKWLAAMARNGRVSLQ